MRILAASDLHLSRNAADKLMTAAHDADVVILAGDFAIKGGGLDDYMQRLFGIKTPTIIVPGNHESLPALERSCRDWSAVHILHGNNCVINDQLFFGLGYEVPCSSLEPWNNHMSEKQAEYFLSTCPDNAILVTHAPPFGVGDLQKDGSHAGSHAIRQIIEQKIPRLHLCGHVHNAWGTGGLIGACWSQNLGPSLNWFRI